MLNDALSELGQSGTVYEISHEILGSIGGVLAVYIIQMYQWRIADPVIRDHWAGIIDHHHHREE